MSTPPSSSSAGSSHLPQCSQHMARLSTENKILRATNSHLRVLLGNALREVDSLKALVSSLEESSGIPKLIPSSSELATVKESDREDGGPLSLLPEEIWEEILRHLQSSKDIQSFTTAYPPWNTILHRTKQVFLMDQVFPLLYRYLNRAQVLSMRLTCVRWRRAVDDFLENNEFRRPPPLNYSGTAPRLRVLSAWLSSTKFLTNSITPLKSELMLRDWTPNCIIVGRQAMLKFDPECEQATPWLQKFGKNLHFLKLESHQNGASWLFWRLVDLLRLLPSLKKLELSIRPVGAPSGVIPAYMEQLENHWKSGHIPPLPQLESLEISEHDLFHGAILKNVLIWTFSKQLFRLGLNQYVFPPGVSLPNLTQLTISCDSDAQLESVLRLDSPVIRLTLYLIFNDHTVSQDYPNVLLCFRVVQQFRSTLRSLYVHFPSPHGTCPWREVNSNLVPLDMPHLTTIGVREFTPISFNLLTGLGSSLRNLHIYSYRQGEGVSPDEIGQAEGEVLNLHKFLQKRPGKRPDLYKSNCWSLLGRLDQLTVTFASREKHEWSYSRDAFQKLQK